MNTVLLDEYVKAEDICDYLETPSEGTQKAFEEAVKVVPLNEDGEPCEGTFNITVTWSPY